MFSKFKKQKVSIDTAKEFLNQGQGKQFQGVIKANPELISAIDEYDLTLLHWAALWGRSPEMSFLIKMGASVFAKDPNGNQPIHCAAQEGHLAAIQLLIENGADIYAKGTNDNTPMLVASRDGHVSVCKYLLENDVRLGAQTDTGTTELHQSSLEGHAKVVELLIHHGADINHNDNEYKATPLHFALNRGHVDVASMLIEAGADIHIQDSMGKAPYKMATTLGLGNLLKRADETGAESNTPVPGEGTDKALSGGVIFDIAKKHQIFDDEMALAADTLSVVSKIVSALLQDIVANPTSNGLDLRLLKNAFIYVSAKSIELVFKWQVLDRSGQSLSGLEVGYRTEDFLNCEVGAELDPDHVNYINWYLSECAELIYDDYQDWLIANHNAIANNILEEWRSALYNTALVAQHNALKQQGL